MHDNIVALIIRTRWHNFYASGFNLKSSIVNYHYYKLLQNNMQIEITSKAEQKLKALILQQEYKIYIRINVVKNSGCGCRNNNTFNYFLTIHNEFNQLNDEILLEKTIPFIIDKKSMNTLCNKIVIGEALLSKINLSPVIK